MTPAQAMQLAIDAFAPPRNDTENKALEALNMTFNQQTEMQKLIETIARMDTPIDGVTDEETADNILANRDDEQLCSDADALYELILAARGILKMKGGSK